MRASRSVASTDNIARKNSPSRLRFRPPRRLTIRFRVLPLGWASTYSRPVLGAEGNVDGHWPLRKGHCNAFSSQIPDVCPDRKCDGRRSPPSASLQVRTDARRFRRPRSGPSRVLRSRDATRECRASSHSGWPMRRTTSTEYAVTECDWRDHRQLHTSTISCERAHGWKHPGGAPLKSWVAPRMRASSPAPIVGGVGASQTRARSYERRRPWRSPC